MRQIHFLNVVPFFTDDPDYMAAQAIRIADEVGLKNVTFCISLHPQGTPAKVRADRMADTFAEVKRKLADREDIRCGILIQSIIGHGWSGPVPLTLEPWMHTVQNNFQCSSRQCPLDRGFRDYICDAIGNLAKSKPAFFLVDDDFCSTKNGECYCDLHMIEYNKRLGREWTREELLAHLKGASPSDPVVQVVTEVLDEGIVSFAREIRAAIDRFAPGTRCGMCFPGCGTYSVEKVTLALAGNTEPFLRIACAIYCGQKPEALVHIARTIAIRKMAATKIRDLIAESDTFPQNLYSMGSMALNAHITFGILNGTNGSKLWNTSMQDKRPESGRAYERIIKRNMGRYQALLDTVDGIEWLGPEVPVSDIRRDYHPFQPTAMYNFDDFGISQAGVFGIPYQYGQNSGKRTRMLAGSNIDKFTDEEIREFFKGNLLLDGSAVLKLASRGFSPLMGIVPGNDPEYFFTAEISNISGRHLNFMSSSGLPQINPAKGAVEVTTLYNETQKFTIGCIRAGAGLTFFTNELGGRVACFAYRTDLPFYQERTLGRRELLIEALDFLEDGRLPGLAVNPQDILFRCGRCRDGSMLAVAFGLNMDPIDGLELRFREAPKSIERLMPDGSWKTVEFSGGEKGFVMLNVVLIVYEPGIFRVWF